MAPTVTKATANKSNDSAKNGNGMGTSSKDKGKKDTKDDATTIDGLTEVTGKSTKAIDSHMSKPDQAAYLAEQEKIKAEIDALQTQLVRWSNRPFWLIYVARVSSRTRYH